MTPVVEITTSGRGGGITYREGEQKIQFDWEFAASPALALVWGPTRADWETKFPWASGRQASIYDLVGAEVVRQKAPDGAFEYDLELGHLTILNANSKPAREQAAKRAAAAQEEQRRHVSVDARLAYAEEMERDGRLRDIEEVLAREIRRLSRPEDGLERALRLAAAHPSETIRQALLWASYNATPCATRCAAQLLTLSGAAAEPFDSAVESMLGGLEVHTNVATRNAAFAELSKRVGMVLDRSPQD